MVRPGTRESRSGAVLAPVAVMALVPLLGAASGCDPDRGGRANEGRGGAGGASSDATTTTSTDTTTTTSTPCSPGSATSADECGGCPGGYGGSDLLGCDYVTVELSTPLAVAGLEIEVDTSLGDHLELGAPIGDLWDPGLALTLASEGVADGFTIIRGAFSPHYAPEWVAVLVRFDQQVVADSQIQPTYSCVALSGDDWCWKASPETVTVTLP